MGKTRILNLYIARTFLGPFLLCVIFFSGLYVMVDFFANIDDFLAGKTVFRALVLAGQYYLLRIPSYLAQIMPVLVVMPAVIAILRLQKTNEIVAIRASGISAKKISVPILACAVIVTILAAFNQEWLVPALQEPLLSVETQAREAPKKKTGFCYVVDRYGRHLLMSSFDPEAPLPTLTGVHIAWEDEHGVQHEKQANRAFGQQTDKDTVWYMEGVTQFDGQYDVLHRKVWERRPPETFKSRSVNELVERYKHAVDPKKIPLMATEAGDRPLSYEFGSYSAGSEMWPQARQIEIIHPGFPELGRMSIDLMVWADDRWLAFGVWKFNGIDPDTKQLREEHLADGVSIADTVKPTYIRRAFRQVSSTMTLSELADAAERFPSSRFRQRCWVIIWNRLSFPLANIVLVLLALPVIFRHSAHSAMLGVLWAVIIALLYMTANFFSIDFAYRQIPVWREPFVAGFMPTVIFAAIAVVFFIRSDRV